MTNSVTTVLTAPGRFFTEREKPGLLGPAAVVGSIVVMGILMSLIGSVIVGQMLSGGMSSSPSQVLMMDAVSIIFAVFGRLFGPFLWWILLAVTFFFITELLGGRGDFNQVLAVTGWGLVPRALTVAFALVLSLVGAVLVSVDVGMIVVNALGSLASLVGAVTTLWSGYIWAHGLAAVRDISVRDGYLAVAPVVILGVLVALGSAVLSLTGTIGMM